MFDFDPREIGDARHRQDIYDPQWGKDTRELDERDRDPDNRARDPRDPFLDNLDLPRGCERELVQDDHEHLYELNRDDARMLATIRAQ